MIRALFKKTENAIWISHLDLMRLLQRAFKRAGLHLTHTQGFNPRPSVSIALPLSVGTVSHCELLDFDLEGDNLSYDEICNALNRALTDGVQILKVYPATRKVKEIAYLQCKVKLFYDDGVPESAISEISSLFKRDTLIVPKKTKNGIQEQNILPLIKRISVILDSEKELTVDSVICCQNPTLNPAQISAAISLYLPHCAPDSAYCVRTKLFDDKMNEFE